jgi:hypothetical protein
MTETTTLVKAGPPVRANAATLYGALLTRTTNRTKRQNLERIWGALEAIRAEAERTKRPAKYTDAEVLRRLRDAGTPIGENTIRNKGQGDDYRALIDEYEAQYAAPRLSSADDDESLTLAIPDQRVAARVRIVMQQNRALRHRIDILHQQLQRMAADGDQKRILAPAAPSGAHEGVSPREAVAVRHFLEHIGQHLWSIDEETGAILDRHQSEIAPPGFVQALRRIAGL